MLPTRLWLASSGRSESTFLISAPDLDPDRSSCARKSSSEAHGPLSLGRILLLTATPSGPGDDEVCFSHSSAPSFFSCEPALPSCCGGLGTSVMCIELEPICHQQFIRNINFGATECKKSFSFSCRQSLRTHLDEHDMIFCCRHQRSYSCIYFRRFEFNGPVVDHWKIPLAPMQGTRLSVNL